MSGVFCIGLGFRAWMRLARLESSSKKGFGWVWSSGLQGFGVGLGFRV